MKRKIVITGINGLLGQNLVRAFEADHELHGLDLVPSVFSADRGIEVTRLDLSQTWDLERYLTELSPAAVIHAAAYTNVDRAEEQRETAMLVNTAVPEALAGICRRLEIPLVHISTDYVFDGSAGPYVEQAVCNPQGVYAESKYVGEQAVLRVGGQVIVIRPNVLYGAGVQLKSSFVAWLLGELRASRSVNIVDDQYNNPTYARRLADVIRLTLEQQAWGIWHFGSKEVVSRYTFAMLIADTFGLPSELIHAISTTDLNQRAPRPLRSGLICEKIARELQVPILSIRAELTLLKEELNAT